MQSCPNSPKSAWAWSPAPRGVMPVHVPVVMMSPAFRPRSRKFLWLASQATAPNGFPTCSICKANFPASLYQDCSTMNNASVAMKNHVAEAPRDKLGFVSKHVCSLQQERKSAFSLYDDRLSFLLQASLARKKSFETKPSVMAQRNPLRTCGLPRPNSLVSKELAVGGVTLPYGF